MLMGPKYFRDPVGNYIMVEFEDCLMENHKFQIASELAKFYKLDDLYWLVILYCGNRYFQFRIFSLPMEEIYYPAPNMVPMPQRTLSSSRFMTCFKSEILVSEVLFKTSHHCISLSNSFGLNDLFMFNLIAENHSPRRLICYFLGT